MPITYRMLPLDEWDRLKPLFYQLFPDAPFPETNDLSCVSVAEVDGEIIAFWFLHLCAHAEPVGVNTILGQEVNLFSLRNEIFKAFKDCAGMEYYICTPDPRLGDILERDGLKAVGVAFAGKIPGRNTDE